MKLLSETQVAQPVCDWLANLGWQVYKEVHTGGQRPDIVGVRGPLLWVVESKTSLSLQLLDQVCEWLDEANYVSIAVPYHLPNRFVSMFLRDQGIGEFQVRGGGVDRIWVDEQRAPSFRRNVDQRRIRRSLHPDQLAQVAGSAGGGYSTPFRRTCDAVRRFVGENPGCTMKQLIDGIKHHYSTPASARNSLRDWILEGKLDGVSLDEQGRLRRGATPARQPTLEVGT